MAYSTGAATDIPDLMSKIETFIAANGWTVDEADSVQGWPAWHKNLCYVSFRYDGTTPQAAGRSMGVYNATGYDVAKRPGDHPGDSGNGSYDISGTVTDSVLDNSRCVYTMGDGPFNYWLFEHDDGTLYYVHIVLEVRQGEFRHFGFGTIDKFGDWGAGASGGEYVYGHRNESGYQSTNSTFLFDAGMNTSSSEGYLSAATMKMIGLPNQEVSPWANCMAYIATIIGGNDDRATNQRSVIYGGCRGGPFARVFNNFAGYPGFTGLIPMTALHIWYLDITNKRSYLLGTQPDVRTLVIANYDAAEEVVIGSETWVMFPNTKKGTLGGNTSLTDSYYAGIAYRKEVT